MPISYHTSQNSSELFGIWILVLFIEPSSASLCQEINLAGGVPPKQILTSVFTALKQGVT